MKILFSCISKSWGGMEMYTLTFMKEYRKLNILVDFLCIENSTLHLESEKAGFKCITIESDAYIQPVAILKISSGLRNNNYNLIHSQASKDLWFLVPALYLAKSKIPLFLTKSMQSYIIKKDFLHRFLYNRVTHSFALSSAVKENMLYSTPCDADKITVIPDGVDLNTFSPNDELRKSFRAEFNIENNEIAIGMIARISYGKGQEELIEAAEILNKTYSNLKFVIAGSASFGEETYEKKVKDLVKQKNIHNIIFTGFYNSAKALNGIDIFIFPSHGESLGIALIEGLLLGKPTIAANTGGVLDLVKDGVNGLLFQVEDSQDLANKIEIFLTKPELKNKLASHARSSIEDYVDLQKVVQRTIDLYDRF